MPGRSRNRILWALWIILTLCASGYLLAALTSADAVEGDALAWGKQFLVPGQTTHGHYQIELACTACHTTPFGGREQMQTACVSCHGDELEQADDSHPVRLFSDPRNFEMLEKVDARYCVSCHVEHKPEITRAMGVTVQADHCLVCHRDVADARPTHEGLEPGSCAAAGCHNYHDNRALYQEFLLQHLNEPAVLATHAGLGGAITQLAPAASQPPRVEDPPSALTSSEQDSDGHLGADPHLVDDWAATRHARAGVNCSGCHRPQGDSSRWIEHPAASACAGCHKAQVESWRDGMHGMRVAQGLSPMTPGQADLPMKPGAASEQLTCNSCHAAHRFDTRRAAVHDCVQCHNDAHTGAFRESPHFQAWQRELSGQAPMGSGVSCATCHMPGMTHHKGGTERLWTQHNQNDNLRPNSKMARSVCMDCHGLQFALDALADRDLITKNFSGVPSRHVGSLDMARRADRAHRARQEARAREKKNKQNN